MKRLLSIAIFSIFAFTIYSQSSTIKRYGKVKNGFKYVITENVFDDGHKESLITCVSIPLLTTLKNASQHTLASENIEWDEDLTKEDLQLTLASKEAIESAFNNALRRVETSNSYEQGVLGQIVLPTDFLSKSKSNQSHLLLSELMGVVETEIELNSGQERTCSQKLENRSVSNILNSKTYLISNGEEEIKGVHIRSLYNIFFADSYSGWANRTAILNAYRNQDSRKLMAHVNISSQINHGDFNMILDDIIADPTFDKGAKITINLVNHIPASNYTFELIQEIDQHNDKNASLE